VGGLTAESEMIGWVEGGGGRGQFGPEADFFSVTTTVYTGVETRILGGPRR
jgi:hypothetical protein